MTGRGQAPLSVLDTTPPGMRKQTKDSALHGMHDSGCCARLASRTHGGRMEGAVGPVAWVDWCFKGGVEIVLALVELGRRAAGFCAMCYAESDEAGLRLHRGDELGVGVHGLFSEVIEAPLDLDIVSHAQERLLGC